MAKIYLVPGDFTVCDGTFGTTVFSSEACIGLASGTRQTPIWPVRKYAGAW
jgi:hypothetical protein